METKPITKVLVANRGEIALRILRAAADAAISSVAVYADPDKAEPFVDAADEAFSLPGSTPAETYLNQQAIIDIAQRAGADAIHPGYGFLAENAEFARAVIDAGLTWIGPGPKAIEALGDKVSARAIAIEADAPLAPGTKHPVADVAEVHAFAEEHGLPVAIKAAHGGGGRGMKIVHELADIEELFESATREATVSFGRGECFIERYLDRARHVEVQVLADMHDHVIVLGTRDCTLQRRFQKLIEEAPAPFLTDEQRTTLHESAKRICRRAGYVGAGTVEFLVGADGLISFLEVNTRLQVEHPVSEQVYGLDIVREQFRIAEGHPLTLTEDPAPRGHAIEFRINGEDPAAGFLPTPGIVETYQEPTGPGVRVDSGVRAGSVIGGQFDSMLAKLIVYGATRAEALQRARRALADYQVSGITTVIPFHRAMLDNPAFAEDFTVYTRWIEEEWDGALVGEQSEGSDDTAAPAADETLVVEVDGRRVTVAMPAGFGVATKRRRRRRRGGAGSAVANGNDVVSPMQGAVVKLQVAEGDTVTEGDVVAVVEAMKMENPVKAHKAGTVTAVAVAVGDQVAKGAPLATIEG